MAEQYWVGDFFVDLTRNQITQKAESQTIPPKALAVLTYLARNANKVISHDELLSEVWSDTVVTPNTLQRSIAQLRKALGDNGDVYIKTHAKKGYSLECDVRWHDKSDITEDFASKEHTVTPLDSESTKTVKSSRPVVSLISIFTAIVVFSVIGFSSFNHQQAPMLSFGELRAVTSTDNGEHASIYSPDGQYVVFHRYSTEGCINNIWAKNTKTQKEIQLTTDFDAYGRHSFSKDGKQLVFIRTVDCSEPVNQKKCYQLMSLDFHKALKSPQPMSLLLECKNSEIKYPQWLNNNDVALLQKHTDHWQLISYSIDEDKSDIVYSVDGGNIIYFDYSVAEDLIALTSVHNDGKYYIETLKPNGELVSSHPIKYPDEIPGFRFIRPNFSSIDNQLIFSTGRQLFTLSTDGKITNISLPLDEPMGTPVFHPNGKQMLVVKGHYDSDIIALPLSKIVQGQKVQKEQHKTHTILQRSILAEDNAIYQPNGKLLAFKSERSGDDQIWIASGQETRQLTNFPMDTYINGVDWADDGKSLLINSNRELKKVLLDGSVKIFNLKHPVNTLFQWDSINQTALANVIVNGIIKFAEINLTDSKIRIINDKRVKWALKTEDEQIIYTDHMDRFWRPGAIEDQLIGELQDQGSRMQFVLKNKIIYGINENFELWSYSLNENEFEVIGKMPRTIDNLTDVTKTQILATLRITSRKEVAELFLRE